MNKDEAIRASVNGAAAAFIAGLILLIFTIPAIITNSGGVLNDPWNFIDVLLMFSCSYGMIKNSRFSAVLIFCYLIVSKIIISIETETFSFLGLFIALIFLYFYAQAIQGTFTFHRIEKNENPEYRTTPRWIYILGIPSGLVIVFLVGIGLLDSIGILPSSKVQSADQISDIQIESLIKNNIVSASDKVLYFYSCGCLSMFESGNVLTQDRVIIYYEEDEQIETYSIYTDEITEIIQEEKGDELNDSVYKVNTDNRWLRLDLSVEENGDQKFIQALGKNLVENKLIE